jgi:cell volume regulation protein A
MTAIDTFSVAVLLVALALIIAVYTSRLSEWIRIPTPALFLIAGAAAGNLVPALGSASTLFDERVVTIALVFILFDGGMHIGWSRFTVAAGAITWLGVAGTAVTAAAIAALSHFLFGFDWLPSLLLGAALSPTDPAVVFSVLGKREIAGRTSTILEGESGANDPVGIALLASLLGATGVGWSAVGSGALDFALQMVIGVAVGVAGGFGLAFVLRRLSLPNEALHSLQTLAFAILIYAAGTLAHGSGFLAVFVAGILVGDVRAPYKREIKRFSAGIASLAEIVAFAVLGLSIRFEDLAKPGVLWIGLALAGLLVLVVRPLLVGIVSLPIRLTFGERAFVLLAGLKGAVPILLGMFILSSGIPGAHEIYAIIFIVVLVSVIVQGGLVPVMTRAFRIRTHIEIPRPWTVDIRFAEPPKGLTRNRVETGSIADGLTVAELATKDVGWISMIGRDGLLVPIDPSTTVRAGDTVLTQSAPGVDLHRIFSASDGHSRRTN